MKNGILGAAVVWIFILQVPVLIILSVFSDTFSRAFDSYRDILQTLIIYIWIIPVLTTLWVGWDFLRKNPFGAPNYNYLLADRVSGAVRAMIIRPFYGLILIVCLLWMSLVPAPIIIMIIELLQ